MEWTKQELPALESSYDAGKEVLEHGLSQAERRGLWLEFGVASGGSLHKIAHAAKSPGECPRVFGFDSFKGLPEEWRWNANQWLPKGTFAQDVIPVVPGATTVIGLFQETLTKWLKKHATTKGTPDRSITFVHVDCDLYSASRFALEQIAPHLAEGAIIVFDELVGFHGFDHHEWRALFEVTDELGLFDFEWLARNGNGGGQQVAIRVHRRESQPVPAPPAPHLEDTRP